MAYFARVSTDGTVLETIVADQDFIDNNAETSSDFSYVETFSDANGKSKRYNYATKGHQYDSKADAFHHAQPYSSWTLDTDTYTWKSPVAEPKEDKVYDWNEETKKWVEIG